MKHGVAARNHTNAMLRDLHPDQPMDEKSLCAQNQNDIPGRHLVRTRFLDRQQITGPQRRKHAHSPRRQAKLAAPAKGLNRKIQFEGFSIFRHR
jgi:hypothetical protein